MRRLFIPLALIAVALAGFGAWSLHARSQANHDTRLDVPNGTLASNPRLDTAVETWRIPPAIVPAPAPRPVTRVVEPAPDWSTLHAGIASATAGPTVSLASAPSPAELDVAMSARERHALIASAREPEGLPGPRGYRPGIAVIIPGGSSSDGVCR